LAEVGRLGVTMLRRWPGVLVAVPLSVTRPCAHCRGRARAEAADARPGQALMYPLLVACKSQSSFRRSAAMAVVDNVRTHAATLVEQAQLVRWPRRTLRPHRRVLASACGVACMSACPCRWP